MKILVACEESQEVCKAFRSRGHEAYSCDIQDCSGGHPEWHIMCDVFQVVNGCCEFETMDGEKHRIDNKWDLLIAHPPCTYLTTAATQCHSLKCYTNEQIIERTIKRIDAIQFFMNIINCNCDKVAVENPQGVMSAIFRQPDQYIQPYYFASSINDNVNYVTKKTGLWLKGLPLLEYGELLPNPMDNAETWKNGKKKNWTESSHGQKARSKTFPGIAQAMAEQWG